MNQEYTKNHESSTQRIMKQVHKESLIKYTKNHESIYSANMFANQASHFTCNTALIFLNINKQRQKLIEKI